MRSCLWNGALFTLITTRCAGKQTQELGWKRSDVVLSTKIFWGGEGPNDVGLSRKHIVEGTKVRRRAAAAWQQLLLLGLKWG